MPTYEYVCDACGHAFEEFQSITAEPLRKCPECRKSRLRRLIGTGAGILFRGSGFYETDYRSESYRKGAEAEKKATEPAKDAKESKPREKAEKATATQEKKPPAATKRPASKPKPAKDA